jgi:uncharacterized protein (TIGR00296 family)
MNWLVTENVGIQLVKIARLALEKFVTEGEIINLDRSEKFSQKAGAFVTLFSILEPKEFSLRGCIGYPLPSMSLWKSVTSAAIKAATADPRFQPLAKGELKNVIIEVSVLSDPTLVEALGRENIFKKIAIGKHGLIFESPLGSGLLLPQVALEHGWDEREFLENLCRKAGLGVNTWLSRNSLIYTFESIIFREESPHGRVICVKL